MANNICRNFHDENINKHYKDYENNLDEKLLKKIKNNKDKKGLLREQLIKKYYALVIKISQKYYLKKGGNDQDLIQEGLIGVNKAIDDYDFKKRRGKFKSFVAMCIKRQIITALKTYNRKKHKPLNNSLSFNKKISSYDNDCDLSFLLSRLSDKELKQPEKILISKINTMKLSNFLKNNLTDLEQEVYSLYIKGEYSYQEISKKIEGNKKTVDNALQRIRLKTEKFIKKHL